MIMALCQITKPIMYWYREMVSICVSLALLQSASAHAEGAAVRVACSTNDAPMLLTNP